MRLSPKLFTVILFVPIAALVVGLPVLWGNLKRTSERGVAEQLDAMLQVLSPLVQERLDQPPSLQEWVQGVARYDALRLTVIDERGVVRADSRRTFEQVGQMDNHGDRPEVLGAKASGRGVAVRRSATLQEDFLYVAHALTLDTGQIYVVRLSEPMSALQPLRDRLADLVWSILLVSILALAVASWWTHRRLLGPLGVIAEGADRMGRGELDYRLDLDPDEELARVGRSLNRLAKQVQEQVANVEAERNHLEVVGASMSEGILVTDAEGKALLANPAFRRLFRVRGDVEGQTAVEMTFMPEIEDMIQATLSTGATQVGEWELRFPARRWLAASSSLLQDSTGVVLGVRDVSDLVQLAEMRRDLVANVSHELKTPLAAIRGYAETLQDGAINDQQAGPRFLGRILQQCARLQALLEDLLTLSRLESSRGAIEFENLDLTEILRETVEVLGSVAREKEVTVSLGLDDDLELEADRSALEELCLNLVDNAIKYNRRGGEVSIHASTDGERMSLVVTDTGRGVPEESLPRLFERFYRVDRGRARQEGGTGLGLAIVKHVVLRHNGEIRVESQLGEGTTFTVELPIRQAGSEPVQLGLTDSP